MAEATLSAIRDKVRRLTRSPSVNQLSTANLDEYINTFIAYDFPEELRLFKLHSNVSLQLDAFQERYDLSTLTDDDGQTLTNTFITINQPVYIDGYKAFFTQSRDEFYNLYTNTKNIILMSTGDAVTTNFTKTISGGYLLPNEVVITSIDATNGSLYVTDDGAGVLSGDGVGTVDYVTGAINVTFSAAPGASQLVNAHIIQYVPNRPAAVLYFEDQLIVRPVPDQPYTLNFEYYRQPTQLLADDAVPELKQWWQYIAYGAAKKVLEDRMDMETVQMIMPEFKKQERLVLRRTIVQNTTQQVATIYAQQAGLNSVFNNYFNGF